MLEKVLFFLFLDKPLAYTHRTYFIVKKLSTKVFISLTLIFKHIIRPLNSKPQLFFV